MKAYILYSDHIEYIEYVKAETPGKAKAQSEFMIFDLDFTDIRARRLPALDNADNFDDPTLWAAGLAVCCLGCSGEIHPNCAEPGEKEIEFINGMAYHPHCAERERSKQR